MKSNKFYRLIEFINKRILKVYNTKEILLNAYDKKTGQRYIAECTRLRLYSNTGITLRLIMCHYRSWLIYYRTEDASEYTFLYGVPNFMYAKSVRDLKAQFNEMFPADGAIRALTDWEVI